MAYKWTKTDGDTLAEHMASFWLYCSFTVNAKTKKIGIQQGYFATYVSHDSNKSLPVYPTPDMHAFTLTGAEGTIKLNHAKYVRTRLSYFANEYNRLHLFQFDVNDRMDQWVNADGWSNIFSEPTQNDDNTKQLKHKLTFGQVSSRYAYQVVSRENSGGTESLGIVIPYLKSSVLSTLLAKFEEGRHTPDKGQVPELTLNFQGKDWPYFKPGSDQQLAGNVQGYVMVTQGAFKSIGLSAEMDEWLFPGQQAKTELVASNLSRVVYESTPFRRDLANVRATDQNSVVMGGDGDQALEVLYLDQMNSHNPVKTILA